MKTVNVCIFEDRRFGIAWDIPSALKFDPRRTRVESGWTFHLHEVFCPENEENNPRCLLIDSIEAYNKADNFVSKELTGYGCLFFDCKFIANGDALRLTESQTVELTEVGTGEINKDALPGLYLALRAAKNEGWHGVIAITSSASGQKGYEKYVNKLREIAKGKRIFSLGHSLVDCDDADELGRSCESAIKQFLQLVGARSSPKERLHPVGTEFWFDNDVDHEKGHPPHWWNAFANLPPDSPAKKAFNAYFVDLFGCTDSEAAKWIQRTHEGNLHSQLKHTLGACGKAHTAKHTVRGPTLFTVLLAASACCPNPMSWIQNVNARVTDDIFAYDCSPGEAKRLLYKLIDENGLLQRLFVWDREHCSSRDTCEPVIVEVQIVSDSLRIKLDSDFSVSRLASRNGTTKKCLNEMNEDLRKGNHPLSISLDETNNTIVFETKTKA